MEKLFHGIAVIFDDEIEEEESTIYKIKNHIQNRNMPVATYKEMPSIEMIDSLSNASFIILDWDYTRRKLDTGTEERVSIPGQLLQDNEKIIINFIETLLQQIFIPVFIFTSQSVDSIKKSLSAAGLWDDDKENRIFIKQKNDITSEQLLFDAIEEWIKAVPSVYVLKEWEKSIRQSKDRLFLQLYDCSPNWVKIIWDMIKEDTIENHNEFGSFLTRSLVNQIDKFSFDEDIISAQKEITKEELQRVVEGEHYLRYNQQPEQTYTGDLFKDGQKYYLNIRAQCDISRKDENGEYNPQLYCIKGKKLRSRDIGIDDICFNSEGSLVFDTDNCYTLDKISEICKEENERKKLNDLFIKHRNRVFFRKGAFLERNDKVIIGCIDGVQAIQFEMDINIYDFNSMKNKRIGRVLPPYITRIQQKCAQNMIREGIMPMPLELFADFEE